VAGQLLTNPKSKIFKAANSRDL